MGKENRVRRVQGWGKQGEESGSGGGGRRARVGGCGRWVRGCGRWVRVWEKARVS